MPCALHKARRSSRPGPRNTDILCVRAQESALPEPELLRWRQFLYVVIKNHGGPRRQGFHSQDGYLPQARRQVAPLPLRRLVQREVRFGACSVKSDSQNML